LVSIAECERSGLLVTFFMAWSPGRRFNAGDSRLLTQETTPPSIPTNPATGPIPTAKGHDAAGHCQGPVDATCLSVRTHERGAACAADARHHPRIDDNVTPDLLRARPAARSTMGRVQPCSAPTLGRPGHAGVAHKDLGPIPSPPGSTVGRVDDIPRYRGHLERFRSPRGPARPLIRVTRRAARRRQVDRWAS
jgi:hypothetical protein